MRVIARMALLSLALFLIYMVVSRLHRVPGGDKAMEGEAVEWQENVMGTAKGATCATGINELIDSFHIPVITHEQVVSLLNSRTTLVQVVNGTILYEPGDREEMIFERQRRESFLDMLHDTLKFLPNRDFELALSVKDCCDGRGPVFSVTRCKGSMQLPMVQWNRMRDGPLTGWNRRMRKSRERVRRHPWGSRKSTAVFRGSVAKRWSFSETGEERQTLLTRDNWRQVGRTILAHLANESKAQQYLDVELRYASDKILDYPFPEATAEISMEQQASKFKYTVIVEGNCGWADRFKSFLAMGTLCLVQQTPCQEYYSLLAKPFQHYLPIHGTLSNLTMAVQWSRDDDEGASRIAVNGMRFVDEYLTESSMRCYMRELVVAYQEKFVGVVPLDPSLVVHIGEPR